jgi:hypothetical protein
MLPIDSKICDWVIEGVWSSHLLVRRIDCQQCAQSVQTDYSVILEQRCANGCLSIVWLNQKNLLEVIQLKNKEMEVTEVLNLPI